MQSRALPLLALLALAACGRSTDAPGAPKIAATPMSNALLDPATEIARRWDTVFSDGAKRAQAAADLGYKLEPLQRTGPDSFGAKAEQVIVLPRSPVKTRSTLAASAGDATLVERYVFTFDATGDDGRDTSAASDVDKTPLRVLMGFLGRFEVQPDDEIKVAMRSQKPITKALPGATITYDPAAVKNAKLPRNRRSTVTIVRTGATAPAPQNQAARN